MGADAALDDRKGREDESVLSQARRRLSRRWDCWVLGMIPGAKGVELGGNCPMRRLRSEKGLGIGCLSGRQMENRCHADSGAGAQTYNILIFPSVVHQSVCNSISVWMNDALECWGQRKEKQVNIEIW